jgi:hypothetical protein
MNEKFITKFYPMGQWTKLKDTVMKMREEKEDDKKIIEFLNHKVQDIYQFNYPKRLTGIEIYDAIIDSLEKS